MAGVLKNQLLMRVAGFTLIELVMVIVLLGIIAGVTVPLMIGIADGWQLAARRNEMSESSNIALDRMIREMRQINDRTSVITANSSSFQFLDVNGNNITFSFSSGHLMRTVGAVSNQLADNVTSLSFAYYNTSGSVVPAPIVSPQETDIRMIVVDLTFSLGGTQLGLESGVSPRRLQ